MNESQRKICDHLAEKVCGLTLYKHDGSDDVEDWAWVKNIGGFDSAYIRYFDWQPDQPTPEGLFQLWTMVVPAMVEKDYTLEATSYRIVDESIIRESEAIFSGNGTYGISVVADTIEAAIAEAAGKATGYKEGVDAT